MTLLMDDQAMLAGQGLVGEQGGSGGGQNLGGGQADLKNKKLDGGLKAIVARGGTQPLNVIVQTKDGLKDEDRKLVASVGGKIKDDLYIIKAFSADLTPKAIEMLILSDRIVRIFPDAEVHN
ncbi:hypothetical protein IJT93_01570 [bacterium]|nr:hypothetical protein [bacterium]